MAKCTIRIELDREDRIYQAGEIVTGKVRVRADEQVDCKALTIDLFWQTHGKGDRRPTNIQSKTESKQSWSPGAERHYPFSLQLPASPLTYHGAILNIDYYVYARANLPWSIDATASEMITVVPGAACEETQRSFEQACADAAAGKKLNISPKSISGIIIFILIVGILAYFVTPLILILMIYALVQLGKKIRTHIAEQRLGKVQAELARTVVCPGQSVSASVRFNTVKRIPVNAVTVRITGEESCTYSSGRNARTYNQMLHKETFSLSPSGHNEFRGDIAIPQTEAYSFVTARDKVSWEALFRIDIPGLPDWQKTIPLYIVPKRPEGQKTS